MARSLGTQVIHLGKEGGSRPSCWGAKRSGDFLIREQAPLSGLRIFTRLCVCLSKSGMFSSSPRESWFPGTCHPQTGSGQLPVPLDSPPLSVSRQGDRAVWVAFGARRPGHGTVCTRLCRVAARLSVTEDPPWPSGMGLGLSLPFRL